ncbi:MAG: hypothetical protein WC860_05140 [Candidatus Margulisiibacteriota bacterium]|jgi:hypothetical protein
MMIDTGYVKDVCQAETMKRVAQEKRVNNVEAFEQVLLKTVYLNSLINKEEDNEVEEESADEGILASNTSQYDELLVDMLSKELAKKDILGLQGISNKKSEKSN